MPACETLSFSATVRIDAEVQPGVAITNQATGVSNDGSANPSDTVNTTIDAELEPIRIDTKLGIDHDSLSGPDPVHTGIGNYYWHKRLFVLSGKTMAVHFSVTYNTLDLDYDGPLGYGWTHSHNIVLIEDSENSEVQIKWGDGHSDFFTDEGSGV